jgi:hypothetical protein
VPSCATQPVGIVGQLQGALLDVLIMAAGCTSMARRGYYFCARARLESKLGNEEKTTWRVGTPTTAICPGVRFRTRSKRGCLVASPPGSNAGEPEHPELSTFTETSGRGGMFIHGATVAGSAACIDLSRKIDTFVADLTADGFA